VNLLFLDDEPYRHKHIQRATKDQEIKVCPVWDGVLAIKELEKNVFDLIMLDHDLCVNMGQEEVCGLDVAKAIVKMGDRHKKATIVVHSLNPIGAKNMFLTLKREGFDVHEIPYAWLMLQYKVDRWVIDTTINTTQTRRQNLELDDDIW
jgi:DNA-binding NtrC family response regulator